MCVNEKETGVSVTLQRVRVVKVTSLNTWRQPAKSMDRARARWRRDRRQGGVSADKNLNISLVGADVKKKSFLTIVKNDFS